MKKRIIQSLLLPALAAFICLLPGPAMAEEFGGFGIVVAQLYDTESPGNRGGIVVLHVPRDSEGQKAGVMAGDVIVEVDGKRLPGREFRDIVLKDLRGKVGSSAVLTIQRMPEKKEITLTVGRSLIRY